MCAQAWIRQTAEWENFWDVPVKNLFSHPFLSMPVGGAERLMMMEY